MIFVLDLVQQNDKMVFKFFLNDLKYTQTVSSFKTEPIYENDYNRKGVSRDIIEANKDIAHLNYERKQGGWNAKN